QAAHARLAQEAGVPASSIVIAENGDVVELTREGVGVVDRIEAGVTFVDGLGVGDITDVALRDRRHMSEDGVLIVVTTLAGGAAARGRARRDGIGGPRGPARPVSPRARGGPGGGPLVVRRAGPRRARRLGAGARARGRPRRVAPGRTGVPRARSARARARRA